MAINAEVADLKAVFTEGGTYQLQSDIDIQGQNLQVASGVNAVLDLNGHTVTAANGSGGNIYVAGNFTLRDSQGTGKIVADKDYIKDAYSAGLIYIDGESAKMTMEGGTIYAVRDDAVNKGQFGVGVYDGGDFTMTGGKIEAGWYAVSGNGTNDTQNSLINIQGGELVSTMDYAVYLPHSGTATISGGTINGAAGGISMQRGTLNISGTAQIMSNGEGNTGEWGDGTGNQSNSALMVGGKYGDCTVTMTGGSLTAEKEALIVTGDSGYQINISISGGTFSDPSALAYLAEGADVDVVLAKDVEITKAILINKNVTVDFDLNGKTLLNQTDLEVSGSYETGAFEISAGTLNISDSAGNGAVKCVADNTDNDGFRMAVWAYGTAKVNISGGSFYNSQKKNAQIDLINVQGTAQLYISGGRFESNGYGTPKDGVGRYWVLNRNNGDTNSVIKVSGGTFVNFNPANPNMDDNDNASYLAEGYYNLEQTSNIGDNTYEAGVLNYAVGATYGSLYLSTTTDTENSFESYDNRWGELIGLTDVDSYKYWSIEGVKISQFTDGTSVFDGYVFQYAIYDNTFDCTDLLLKLDWGLGATKLTFENEDGSQYESVYLEEIYGGSKTEKIVVTVAIVPTSSGNALGPCEMSVYGTVDGETGLLDTFSFMYSSYFDGSDEDVLNASYGSQFADIINPVQA